MMIFPLPGGAVGCSRAPQRTRATAVRGAALLIQASAEPGDSARDVRLQALASAVQRALPRGWHVAGACARSDQLYSAIETAARRGDGRLVIIPLHPQFSRERSGASLTLLYRVLGELARDLHVQVRASWHGDAQYIEALTEQVLAATRGRGRNAGPARLLLAARGDGGDLGLVEQLGHTLHLLRIRLGWPASRCGTWLIDGPEPRLDGSPAGPLILCPADPLEDPAALAGRLSAFAAPAAAEVLPCPGLSDSQPLVKTLALLVRRGPQPMAERAPVERPGQPRARLRPLNGQSPGIAAPDLRAHPFQDQDLFMVGVSVAGALACGRADARHCSQDDLLRVKLPYLQAVDLIRDLRQRLQLPECLLWNTCNRFELYCWLPPCLDEPERRALVEQVAQRVGRGLARLPPRRRGEDVTNHLLRTAAGLNSRLIGDADILDQLSSALGMARAAGAAGPRCQRLVQHVRQVVLRLRSRTAWGRFTHRYSQTALSLLPEDVRETMRTGRVLVLGGSTTAAGVVEALLGPLGLQPRQVRLVHRQQRWPRHPPTAILRQLTQPPAGRPGLATEQVICVPDYRGPRVARELAGADVAILTTDQAGAVALPEPRGCGARQTSRLIVVDFNAAGSIAPVQVTTPGDASPAIRLFDAGHIDALIAAFNTHTRACPRFNAALAEAEEWLAQSSRAPIAAHAGDLQEVLT